MPPKTTSTAAHSNASSPMVSKTRAATLRITDYRGQRFVRSIVR